MDRRRDGRRDRWAWLERPRKFRAESRHDPLEESRIAQVSMQAERTQEEQLPGRLHERLPAASRGRRQCDVHLDGREGRTPDRSAARRRELSHMTIEHDAHLALEIRGIAT